MNKIKVAISISAVEALGRGGNSAGKCLWEVPDDLPQALRDEIATFSAANRERDGYDFKCPFSVGSVDDFLPMLEARAESRRKQREEDLEQAAKWLAGALATLPEDWVSGNNSVSTDYKGAPFYLNEEFRLPLLADLRLVEIRIAAREIAAARAKETAEKNLAIKLARETAEAAAKEELAASIVRKTAQIDYWVAERGTENQQARHKLGLLPQEEALILMRAEAFAPLERFPRYVRLLASDVPCSCDYEEPTVGFDVFDSVEATAEEYDALAAIQRAVPKAQVVLRSHVGTCRECEGEIERKSIRVEITFGEFNLSREYGV